MDVSSMPADIANAVENNSLASNLGSGGGNINGGASGSYVEDDPPPSREAGGGGACCVSGGGEGCKRCVNQAREIGPKGAQAVRWWPCGCCCASEDAAAKLCGRDAAFCNGEQGNIAR